MAFVMLACFISKHLNLFYPSCNASEHVLINSNDELHTERRASGVATAAAAAAAWVTPVLSHQTHAIVLSLTIMSYRILIHNSMIVWFCLRSCHLNAYLCDCNTLPTRCSGYDSVAWLWRCPRDAPCKHTDHLRLTSSSIENGHTHMVD